MLASIIAFLRSLFNLTLDVILKAVVALVVTFLLVTAIVCWFAVLIVQLVT